MALSPVLALAQPQVATPEPLTAASLDALQWRNIGPAIRSGRVVDIAVDPRDREEVYVASAAGGLWKSVNHGTTWEAVFDAETTVSLGAIAIAPSNPNVIWAGTGEANNQRSTSWGDGVYKSEDGGKSWTHKGLQESRHVGGFAIHPDDPDLLVVGTHGRGIWILDDVAILEQLAAAVDSGAHLAAVRAATQYNTFNRGRDSQGARCFRAPNPPRGAILTYYFGDQALQAEPTRRAEVGLAIVDASGAVVRGVGATRSPSCVAAAASRRTRA